MIKSKGFYRFLFRASQDQGGYAMIMLLVFMVLAVPLVLSSTRMASQLAHNSRNYEKRLTGDYAAASGVELAVSQILDPSFDDGLTSESPSTNLFADVNNGISAVGVTKIPTISSSEDGLQQTVVVTKTVSPSTAPEDTTIVFTYTITIENEEAETVIIKQISDSLPPFISYIGPTTGGITSSAPIITPDQGNSICGDTPDQLTWSVSPGLELGPQAQASLSFLAIGNLPEGTYYNQAQVRYQAPWSSEDVYSHAYQTAEVVVGAGNPYCGFNLFLMVDAEVVSLEELESGEIEATYNINVENISWADILATQIQDLLPPGFSYVADSSTGVTAVNPVQTLEPLSNRWRLTWGDSQGGLPLVSILSSETATLTFKARGMVQPGVDPFNQAFVRYDTSAVSLPAEASADVVLVLDNSGSIDLFELLDLQSTAHALIDAFNLPDATGRIRIGIARYRGSSASVTEMTDLDTPLHDGIISLVLGGLGLLSGTDIVEGLEGGATQFATGLGDRPEAPNLMIFITDGTDTEGNSLAEIAEASQSTGAEVFAIGVGDVTEETLDAIASAPDEDHVFYTDDFGGLLELADEIFSAVHSAAQSALTQDGVGFSTGVPFDVESVAPDGTAIRSRLLLTPGGEVKVLSWQQP